MFKSLAGCNQVISGMLLSLAFCTAPALAATLWDGADRPSTTATGNGYAENGSGFGGVFSADDPSPGFMTQHSGGVGASCYFGLSTPGTELNRAAGWTIEIRNTITNSTGDFGMFAGMNDNVGGVGVLFEPTQIEVWDGNFSAMLFSEPITAGFHSYFFSMSPAGTSVDLYIDGVLENSGLASLGGTTPAFNFGDGTSGAAADGVWDYVYVNGPPIPEPASLSLLALGALSLIRRRK